MSVSSDLWGALLMLAIVRGLLAVAAAWARYGSPDPESTRKLVHLGGGIACLLFPLVITSPWVVLALSLGLVVVFVSGARRGFLKSITRVTRKSRGSEFYPLAVFLLFLIAREAYWLYVAGILVLALADTGAALIGTRVGKHRFQVAEGEHKSLEGSLAYCLLAFLSIFLPMLWLGGFPLVTSVLVAFLVSVLLGGLEAVCVNGTDNICIPIVTCYGLMKITTKPQGEILFQCASLLFITSVVVWLAWKLRIFDTRTGVILTIFAYATWSLGSTYWAFPVFLCLLLFAVTSALDERSEQSRRLSSTTIGVLFVPSLLLIVANTLDNYDSFFGPFVAACMTTIGLCLTLNHQRVWSARPGLKTISLAAATAWFVVVLPVWLAGARSPLLGLPLVGSLGLLLMIPTARLPGLEAKHPEQPWRWFHVGLVMVAAGLYGSLQQAGVVDLWPDQWR